MNTERLLKLAAFLETLPPHKFNFESYIHLGEKSPAEALAAPDEHCGTTACAVGWMPAVFPEDFEWRSAADMVEEHSLLPYAISLLPYAIGAGKWWDETQQRIHQFFGIHRRDFDYLFVPNRSPLDSSATALQVATQIREFVATEGESRITWDEDQQEAYTEDSQDL